MNAKYKTAIAILCGIIIFAGGFFIGGSTGRAAAERSATAALAAERSRADGLQRIIDTATGKDQSNYRAAIEYYQAIAKLRSNNSAAGSEVHGAGESLADIQRIIDELARREKQTRK